MTLIDDIKEYVSSTGGILSEKIGLWTFEVVIAERKSFLAKKKLVYRFKFRIDDEKNELRYTEMLKESGAGISSGSDSGATTGFGFKAEKYGTGLGKPREGTIEEQSNLFGKHFDYVFDFSIFRGKIIAIAKLHGYAPIYHLTSAGI